MVILTAEEESIRVEVRHGTSLPITVDMTWDQRLQLLSAVVAGVSAFLAAMRQRR